MATRSSGKSSTRKSRKSSDVEHAEGLVKVVSKKKIKTKNGMKPVYSICVEDEDGDETWYRTGFDMPECDKGDTIEFDFEETDYGLEIDVSTLNVVEGDGGNEEEEEEEEERPTRKAKGKTTTKNRGRNSGTEKQGKGQTKEGYWEKKEASDADKDLKISYAASRNAAITMVSQMIELGVLTLPAQPAKGATKASTAKRVDAFEAYVDQYTNQFFARVVDVDGLRATLEDAGNSVKDAVDEGEEEEEGDED